MGKMIIHKAFLFLLIFVVMILVAGCSRDHTTGKNKASAEGSEDVATESIQAEIVVADLITSSGANGEPLAYIIINRGDWVNFKGNVTGGNPPYTYNWDFDNVRPSMKVKDPGNIEYINVTGTNAGILYSVEFTATDKNGNQSVDSIEVLVFDD